ncbi:hypothetical protein ACLKA6_014666 [Drosophila palustris]
MSHMFDEEVLESLTYERSKTWSSFLSSFTEKDDGREIEMSKLEEIFKDDNDDETVVAKEEAEESDGEDDINNATHSMTKAELTLMLCSGDNKEILDHTMPIVEEHVRKWKEAGLDRILNTFDAQKIEEHVGDWLRRHNSAYGDKTLLQATPPKTCHKRYKKVDCLYTSSSNEDSEAESMHSVETARYIRDSRKHTVSTATKCRSPMTKIKMYRTLPRKRAELRAKYACHEFNEEQEHRHHMQSLIQRRKQLHRRQRERELIYHTSPRHYPYSVPSSFNGQQLRKRRDISRVFHSSSSSDDEHGSSRCACSPCARSAISKTAYPYYTYRSYHSHTRGHSYRDYPHDKRVELGSRSMASMVHFKHSVRQLRRQHAFEEDLRPRLIENECSCCNNERLCSKVVHIANSSTEDWVVENKSSPDPMQCETPKNCKSAPANHPKSLQKKFLEKAIKSQPSSVLKKTLTKALSLPEEDKEYEVEESKSKFNIPKSRAKTKAAVTFSNVESTPSKSLSSKNKPTLKASSSNHKSAASANKEKSLPRVFSLSEISKESNNSNELPAKTEKPVVKANIIKETKQEKAATKSARKFIKTDRVKSNTSKEKTNASSKVKQSKKKAQITESSESDEDLKQALILSKVSYVAELERVKPKADPQKNKDSASESPQLPDQSVFNNHSVACNSTALTNDTASTRALQPEKINKSLKPGVAASTSNDVIDLCNSGSFNVHPEGDADCTMVTSTTGCEAGASVPGPATAPQRPHLKISKKGVLLYEPPQSTANGQNQSISSSNSSANFTLTEQILSPIIGKRRARKFLKYYTGSCSFDSRYYVYYRPPGKLLAALSSDSKSLDLNSSSSSGSEDDIFEIVDRYGVIHTMLEKCSENC